MNHDAAMAVVDYSSGIGEVLWAAHAEPVSYTHLTLPTNREV